jgi:type IV pilus assembly protein PilF
MMIFRLFGRNFARQSGAAFSRLGLSALLSLAVVLSACAPARPVQQSGDETYTASDMPPLRKRASNRLQLAVLYFQDGKPKFAMDEVKQAIQIDPDWYEPYWMRGLIQMQLNDLPAAEDSFRKALGMNPGSADLKHNYAVLLCKMQRYPEGLALFDTVLATPTYTQRVKTLMERGNCQLANKQAAAAQSSFMQAYDMEPGNPLVAVKLAQLLQSMGDAQAAQKYIRAVNNSDKATAESLWLGVRIERRLGNNGAVEQLGGQLRKRFADSREAMAFERGSFDE